MTQKTVARRAMLKSALAGAAVAGLAAPKLASAQSTVTWRMQALWDGGTTPQKFEEQFVARVAELTGGRFKINLFAAGQIVPAAQAFDAVRGGAFEMMKTFDGYEAGKIPAFAFTSTIPFGFAEPDEYEAWFYEKGGLEMARQAYAPAGLHYIAPTVYGQEPLHSKVPIRKIADLVDLLLAVIELLEGFALPRRAAIVEVEHRDAACDVILDVGCKAGRGIGAWSAMNAHEHRRLAAVGSRCGHIQQSGERRPVTRGEADRLGNDHLRQIEPGCIGRNEDTGRDILRG